MAVIALLSAEPRVGVPPAPVECRLRCAASFHDLDDTEKAHGTYDVKRMTPTAPKSQRLRTQPPTHAVR